MLTVRFYSEAKREPRSLLSGVNQAIQAIGGKYGFIGFAGTSFTLQHAKVLESLVGKDSPNRICTNFVYHNRDLAWDYLSQHLDLTDCDSVFEEPDIMCMLEGRPRLTSRVIMEINEENEQYSSKNKADALKLAITNSFTHHIKTASDAIKDKLKQQQYTKLMLKTLETVAVAICADSEATLHVVDGPFDLMEYGICHVRKVMNQDRFVYLIQEPLTQAIVANVLATCTTTTYSSKLLRDWANNISKIPENSARGKMFDKLVGLALLREDAIRCLLRNCDIYSNKGKLSVDAVADLCDMKFTKLLRYDHLNLQNPNEVEHGKRTALDLYASLSDHVSGTLIWGDEMFGPDLAGVFSKQGRNYSLQTSCKLIASGKNLTDHTKTSDAQLQSCYYWHNDRNVFQVRNKETAAKKSNSGERKANVQDRVLNPTLNLTYEAEFQEFNMIYQALERVLLISCILPCRHPKVTFNLDKLTDNELLIHIDRENMIHLFADEGVCETISLILDTKNQDIAQLENEIALRDDFMDEVMDDTNMKADIFRGKRRHDQISNSENESISELPPSKRPAVPRKLAFSSFC
jgi:hypothetical protein